MDINRGDIFYIERCEKRGRDYGKGDKPAVVLSTLDGHKNTDTIAVAFLSLSANAQSNEYRVPVRFNAKNSFVICNSLCPVEKSRATSFAGHVSDETLAEIDKAVCLWLGIEPPAADQQPAETSPTVERLLQKIEILEDMYRRAVSEKT